MTEIKNIENIENNSIFSSPLGDRGSSYDQTIKYLYDRLPVFHQIGTSAYKPGLENSIRLMDSLENPQKNYKTIHIAGTNGKGSVSHMLAAVLQKAGYKTGLYTSPHLVDFRERIRVNGVMIDQQYVVDFVENHKSLFDIIEPSFFEATMAMAFDYFYQCDVDVAIIEVGLGGRLDSTNIILPELSVITNISYDHMAFLGNTLDKIAFEKAGIIKPKIPVVIGELLPETIHVFELKSREVNAPIFYAEDLTQLKFKKYEDNCMVIENSEKHTYKVGLCGNYQLKNIATALTAIDQLNKLDYHISIDAIEQGLEKVTELTGLQGRWQVLGEAPLTIADTGHNEGGFKYIVQQLKAQKYKSLRIVIGMVNDKDIQSVLALLPAKAQYYFTRAAIERALPSKDLKLKAERYGLKGEAYLSVAEAVTAAKADSGPNDLIFIGGSNFVVGEALTTIATV